MLARAPIAAKKTTNGVLDLRCVLHLIIRAFILSIYGFGNFINYAALFIIICGLAGSNTVFTKHQIIFAIACGWVWTLPRF